MSAGLLFFFTGLFVTEVLALLFGRDSFAHPFRHGFALEVMVKELSESNGEVFSVLPLDQVVVFLVVDKEPARFVESPEGGEVLDALSVGDGTVLIVVHDQEGRFDFIGEKDRAVFPVAHGVFPHGSTDSALTLFVLELADEARSVADSAVCAEHVADGGSGSGGGEHFGFGDEVSGLVAAPALALDSDSFGVNIVIFDDVVDAAHDA